MNEHEDELQQWLEDEHQQSLKNIPDGFDPEALAAYRWLNRELSREPAAGPPYGFADKTARVTALRYHRRKDRQLYLIAAIVSALCLLAAGTMVAETGAVSVSGLYDLAVAHSGLAIVITGFFLLLLADQRLRYRRVRQLTIKP